MARNKRNVGFGGRMFLHESEWLTYCRRKPVRYIRRPRATTCQRPGCVEPESLDNPLQSAHKIGFDIGVVDLGLTPEFLDSETNIVTAHRCTCNRALELDLSASMALLRELGVPELPKYLPAAIHEAWAGAVEECQRRT